jgi:hypothetical protein
MIPIPCKVQFVASHMGQPIQGVLLLAAFGVRARNTYRVVIGPTDENGVATVTRDEICHEAKALMQMAMMDYEPLEQTFSGQIGIEVMCRDHIERALEAFSIYKTHCQFPIGYEGKLLNALRHSSISKAQYIRVARAV